jgi:hypothetical protein
MVVGAVAAATTPTTRVRQSAVSGARRAGRRRAMSAEETRTRRGGKRELAALSGARAARAAQSEGPLNQLTDPIRWYQPQQRVQRLEGSTQHGRRALRPGASVRRRSARPAGPARKASPTSGPGTGGSASSAHPDPLARSTPCAQQARGQTNLAGLPIRITRVGRAAGWAPASRMPARRPTADVGCAVRRRIRRRRRAGGRRWRRSLPRPCWRRPAR